ncbi:TDT family transporter [Bacillus thuringiensis]|uniref:TDT family transporter n=1 Tax=Bacillus thuringiensis TaxID=1428 RepID=UPI0026E33A12|nr:TDT family transporter [Bacillus thuringiensis]MDO6632236.1 TDT family transporter [Bacillus thuringiensis]MDO6661739.1 TDT family transporter [Bacillus thuringiensis]MDO6702485.1 TDT family transporter [Bacillus thuringiensis]
MMKKLQHIPIPISGLVLALFSIAKLQISFHMNVLAYVMLTLGIVFLAGLFCKIFYTPKQVLNDLKNPIIAAVSPTFTMAIMVLCSIFMIKSAIWEVIWIIAVIVHFALMIYFTYRFVLKSKVTMSHIYPSWFIMYIGMAIMPLTAGNLAPSITTVVFWASIVFYIILLPLVLIRIFVRKNLEIPTQPLTTILCAPGSLALAAYLAHFNTKSIGLIWILLILSQTLYIIVLWQLPKLLRLPFYPSYAAFTFPLVICATAFTNTLKYLGYNGMLGHWVSIIETIIASTMVIYVAIRYSIFLIQQIKQKQSVQS